MVDSWYDSYLGVVTLVRVKNGTLTKRQKIRFMGSGAAHEIDRVGVFTPKPLIVDRLGPGEVGFITAAVKDLADARVGDTITDDRKPAEAPLPGFKPSLPITIAAGQKPVKADCSRLRPTKVVSSSHQGETKWVSSTVLAPVSGRL